MTLELHALSVGYRQGRRSHSVLQDVTLMARPGELTALIGPNGAGKSTLLRSIAGLQPLLAGHITLDGADLARMPADERARRQAVVLTERVAPGMLTARELVALGRHPHTGFTGRLSPADWDIVDRALDDVDATSLADRDLSELSDGERQRVMTARALAQETSLLLMDEPSAFLDAPGRVALTGLVGRIAADQDKIVILSTHEVELALRVADMVWLVDRAGTVHAATPEEIVLTGTLGAVFDSDQLQFDPASFGFVLTGDRVTGRVRITGQPHPVVANLLSRRGWLIVDDDGPVAAELRFTPDAPPVTGMPAPGTSGGVTGTLTAEGRTVPINGIRALDLALRELAQEPAGQPFIRSNQAAPTEPNGSRPELTAASRSSAVRRTLSTNSSG